jgi:hypothetical protein
MEAAMAIAILQSDDQVVLRYSWLIRLYSAITAARQKQADARLAHLTTQRSSFANAKAEQARAELRKYSIG